MLRKIIKIEEDKCNGCGLCADACHEGAIKIIDGKAKLIRDDYCDGLGNCLPVCPTGAISFEERDAAAYDEQAVNNAKTVHQPAPTQSHGCPGMQMRTMEKKAPAPRQTETAPEAESQLRQWPVQIKLVPVNAPYFKDANLLIAADCTAYAYGDFHTKFMKNKVTLIGCPKLDEGDYSEKLTAILKMNDIKSVTIARMEVPCCGGLSNAAITALRDSGKMIPWNVVTIGVDGRIVE